MKVAGIKIVAAASAASLVLAVPVLAHDDLDEKFAECTCVTRHDERVDPLGRITRADGYVFATTTIGYRNATVGMPLNDGSEVTTGTTGSAQILVGKTCRLNVDPNRQVTVSLPAGPTHNICVAMNELGPGSLPEYIRVGIAIKALVGFGLTGIILSGGDDPASD